MKIVIETRFNKEDERVSRGFDLSNPYNAAEFNALIAELHEVLLHVLDKRREWVNLTATRFEK